MAGTLRRAARQPRSGVHAPAAASSATATTTRPAQPTTAIATPPGRSPGVRELDVEHQEPREHERRRAPTTQSAGQSRHVVAPEEPQRGGLRVQVAAEVTDAGGQRRGQGDDRDAGDRDEQPGQEDLAEERERCRWRPGTARGALLEGRAAAGGVGRRAALSRARARRSSAVSPSGPAWRRRRPGSAGTPGRTAAPGGGR